MAKCLRRDAAEGIVGLGGIMILLGMLIYAFHHYMIRR
jgi:hypothetical protein